MGGAQSGSNITVGIGGEATCTITNNDQPGTIVVIKNAKPTQGSFGFTTTGTGYNGFTLTGATTNNGNVNTQTLNAGSYTQISCTSAYQTWSTNFLKMGNQQPARSYQITVVGRF